MKILKLFFLMCYAAFSVLTIDPYLIILIKKVIFKLNINYIDQVAIIKTKKPTMILIKANKSQFICTINLFKS